MINPPKSAAADWHTQASSEPFRPMNSFRSPVALEAAHRGRKRNRRKIWLGRCKNSTLLLSIPDDVRAVE
jgi:hypothetical protein